MFPASYGRLPTADHPLPRLQGVGGAPPTRGGASLWVPWGTRTRPGGRFRRPERGPTSEGGPSRHLEPCRLSRGASLDLDHADTPGLLLTKHLGLKGFARPVIGLIWPDLAAYATWTHARVLRSYALYKAFRARPAGQSPGCPPVTHSLLWYFVREIKATCRGKFKHDTEQTLLGGCGILVT